MTHMVNVNWTLAVMEGYLNPKGSLVPGAEEEKPLDLNVFIEAKVAAHVQCDLSPFCPYLLAELCKLPSRYIYTGGRSKRL